MVKSYLHIFFILGVFVANSHTRFVDWSLESGAASYAELKLARSAEELAYANGGVGLALESDTSSFVQYHRFESASQIGLSFQKIIWQNSSFGFSAQIYDHEDLQGLDEFDRETGIYAASLNDFALYSQWSYARLNIQVEAHYINSRIANAFSQGAYVNTLLTQSLSSNLDYGFQLLNLGGASSYDRNEVFLPLIVQSGLVYHLPRSSMVQAKAFSDLRYVNDTGASLIIGGEMWYGEFLGFHTGVEAINPQGETQILPTNVGLSLALEFGTFKYAYQSQDLLSESHWLEFQINF